MATNIKQILFLIDKHEEWVDLNSTFPRYVGSMVVEESFSERDRYFLRGETVRQFCPRTDWELELEKKTRCKTKWRDGFQPSMPKDPSHIGEEQNGMKYLGDTDDNGSTAYYWSDEEGRIVRFIYDEEFDGNYMRDVMYFGGGDFDYNTWKHILSYTPQDMKDHAREMI